MRLAIVVGVGALVAATTVIVPGVAPPARADAFPGTFSGEATDCQYTWTVKTAGAFEGRVDCPQGVGADLNFRSTGAASGTTAHVAEVTLILASGESLISFRHDVTAAASADDPATAPAFWQEFTEKEVDEVRAVGADVAKGDKVATWVRQATFSQISNQYLKHCKEDALQHPDDPDPICSIPKKISANATPPDGPKEVPCPPEKTVDDIPKDVREICIPTILAGDWTVKKPTLRVRDPYGALLILPVGSLSTPTQPTISVQKSIEVEFGGIFGVNARFKAEEFKLRLGFLAMAGKTRIDAKTIEFGDPSTIDNIRSWTWSYAGRLVAAASDTFTIAKHSIVSANGGGGPAGVSDPPGAMAPGGSVNGWGGSHGGLGGMPSSYRNQVVTYPPSPGGPGPITDSPFDPIGVGWGGASIPSFWPVNTSGSSGGGLVRIAADKVRIDGELLANGQDGALQHGWPGKTSGGGGAGGGISIRATEFGGTGAIQADGGAPCTDNTKSLNKFFPDNEGGCAPSWGAGGGGGRVAIRYIKRGGWKGRLEARPRRNDVAAAEERPGGAGTLFWLQRTGKQLSAEMKAFGLNPDDMTRLKKIVGQKTQPNDGTPRDGVLIVDGRWSLDAGWAAAWPPLMYTPIPDTWSSPRRDLLVRGGARVLANKLRFRHIAVTEASEILSGLPNVDPIVEWCRGQCGGGNRLELVADEILVDETSRIDATGTGGAGAPAGGNAESPGGEGSTGGFGGSHGGLGGACGHGGHPAQCVGSPGTTYDSQSMPTMPGAGGASMPSYRAGAPGGGVIVITAKTLKLDGTVGADGLTGQLPTAAMPVYYMQFDGAGAGGSIRVAVHELAGNGQITASGGDSCLLMSQLLPLDWLQGCPSPFSAGGGGGGGRIAVRYAEKANWHGHFFVRGGRNVVGEETAGYDFGPARGGAGSIFVERL